MNVAMCIPTYNRSKVVEDTLSRGIENYKKYGIDIYYYDGSTNDDTKKLVQKYIDQGYTNIKYISESDPEKRHVLCFTGGGLEKEYDYVWPVKDRVWFEEPTLVKVMQAMQEGHDAIFLGVLPCFSNPTVGTKVYTEPEEFYRDWGYLVTSLDVNIFKRETMISELTYDKVMSYSVAYTHFDIMFRGLNEKGRTVKALVEDDIIAYNSKLISSGWKKNAFSLWVDSWIDINDKLPERYRDYKDIVIKQAGKLSWIFGSVESLIDFKEQGAFENIDIEELSKKWSRVSNIRWDKVLAINNGTYDERHDIDRVPQDMDEFLGLIVKMAQLIKEGNFTKEQIPFNDVLLGAFNKAKAGCKNNIGCANIALGSLVDIIKFIQNDAKTTEEVTKALQLIITIVMISLPNN